MVVDNQKSLMDSLTQAALGASIGEAMFGKNIGNKGAIAGAIIATIPDLDVVFLPMYSDVARLSIHRGFSHSIVFSIIAAILITLLLSRLKWGKGLSKFRLGLFAFLALFTHIMLDAFTTYGTQLLLPLSDYRVGFDSINVVDPVYTLPLLIGLLLSLTLYRNSDKRKVSNTVGLVVSTVYLSLTLGVKAHVSSKFEAKMIELDSPYSKLLTVPVSIGSMNWYGVAKSEGGIWLGRYSLLENEPLNMTWFESDEQLLSSYDKELVDRLKWFAKGFYVVRKSEFGFRFYNLQVDMQGIKDLGNEQAPTAFYFEVQTKNEGYQLNVGSHGD